MNEPLVRDEQHLAELLGVPFSPEQLEAITSPKDKPSVIIAGAGSGKTTVMAARVVWLAGHLGIAPDRILGLTFTNKAAAELKHKILTSLGTTGHWENVAEPTVSTYHAFAGALISEHGLRLGIEPDLRVVSDASKFQRLASVITTYDGVLAHVSTHLPTLIADVVALDGQLAEHLVTPAQLRSFDTDLIDELERVDKPIALHKTGILTAQKRIELSHIVDRYRRRKAHAGVMDFSDQMAWGAELAANPEVGSALRERFDVVLLDEYQDTSIAQRDLLKALFSGPDDTTGRGHSVTSVGDPAQGIYGWRGAAAGNLAEFLDHFPCADGSRGLRHSLATSRRCAPEIIEIANVLAEPFYRTSDVVSPLKAADGNRRGTVTAACYPTVTEEIETLVSKVVAAHGEHPWSEIAILVRQGAEIAEIVAALRGHDVPVEVVGLNGLLAQPEIQDILAVLDVVDDVTANPSLLRLLTGPLWRIGARDLALLGRRASSLSGGSVGPSGEHGLDKALQDAVAGTDPTEVLSLADALDDPGPGTYSAEARLRFSQLSKVLSSLRTHVSEPVVDFVRRVVHTLDLDIELEAGPLSNGMDNIALLLEAVAGYAENDRFASLSGLLGYLRFEEQYNDGMEVSAPSDADSVKLLTAHKSKGLEWEAVFVPFMSAKVFPSDRGRPKWISNARAVPTRLRGDRVSVADIEDWSTAGAKEFSAALRAESDNEELRLGYVAFTRAKRALHLSGHVWGRTQVEPRGPSPYLHTVGRWLEARGQQVDRWAETPAKGAEHNPYSDSHDRVAWPAPLTGVTRRRELAAMVHARLADDTTVEAAAADDESEAAELAQLAELDADLELLVEEARRARVDEVKVTLPSSLSATTALRLATDEETVARDLARPMPRRPSPAAHFGTRFHAWVEAYFGQQTLLDPSDLPGRGDSEIVGDADLAELVERFRAGPYGESQPFAIEQPFSIVIAGQQIIGRIDAVYRTPSGFEVVDWKTNTSATADEVQLAIYRLAWAELQGIEPTVVTGAFYYVRLAEVQRFDALPGRDKLTSLLGF